jgi:NAD dependent epimerase/dehydratase family enzyme
VFVSSSAVGFYGTDPKTTFTEDAPNGRDYLAQVCKEWEAAAAAVPAGVRVVIIRTGIVLAREGGVVGKMCA